MRHYEIPRDAEGLIETSSDADLEKWVLSYLKSGPPVCWDKIIDRALKAESYYLKTEVLKMASYWGERSASFDKLFGQMVSIGLQAKHEEDFGRLGLLFDAIQQLHNSGIPVDDKKSLIHSLKDHFDGSIQDIAAIALQELFQTETGISFSAMDVDFDGTLFNRLNPEVRTWLDL